MITRILSVLLFIPLLLRAEMTFFNGADFKEGYYIVPDKLPADETKLWVVVDVHGANGLKSASETSWMTDLFAPTPVIVIVPSFTNGYQHGDGEWADQLIKNFKTVEKLHPVHEKMFVHGFSGGGQFAHRFTMNESKRVIACSAHSSGSWACDGGHGKISSTAKDIPFFISCGEEDTDYSVKGYEHTRIEWYHLFAEEMEKKNFRFLGKTWPGVGHTTARELRPLVGELFQLATAGTPPTSEGWKGDPTTTPDSPDAKVTGATLNASTMTTLRAANDAISSGRAPDSTATLRFLSEHPASTWVNEEEFAPLAEHCRETIVSYLAEREKSGSPLTGDALARFNKATSGLGL